MQKSDIDDRWITIKILREQHARISKVVKITNDYLSEPEFIRVAINKELKRQEPKK